MSLRTRLQQMERRATALPAPRPEESLDDEWTAWCRGGCSGPLPSAGSRPAKYRSEEDWQKHHRFLLALCCRSVGRPDPPGMTADERREANDAIAFFASMDANGQRSLCPQARLAPPAGVRARFPTDPGGGIGPLDRRGEST